MNAPTGMQVTVEPSEVILGLGESLTFTVTADVSALAPDQWHFANIIWQHNATPQTPSARLPLAVYVVEPDQARLEKTADITQADPGDTASYTITLFNDAPLTTTFVLRDPIPENASYVTGSATGGLAYDSATDTLTSTIELDGASVELTPDSLHGYISLAPYTSTTPCPGDCDNGAFVVSGLDFYYFGQQVTDLVWSTNGYLQVGADIPDLTAPNQDFPDPTAPNHVLAPLWADLDLDGCTVSGRPSAWYRIFAQVNGISYYIFEWENAALKSDPNSCFTFQVWIKTGTSEIWFVYGPQTDSLATGTVGIENQNGNMGDTYFYNGTGIAPANGTTLKVDNSVVFTYQLEVGAVIGVDVVNTVEVTNNTFGRVYQDSVTVQVGARLYLPLLIR